MSPISVLAQLGLASWSTIYFGFKKGWVERADIFEYAMNQISIDRDSQYEATIAGSEYLSDEELLKVISEGMGIFDCDAEMDKWRLAYLLCIDGADASAENRITMLQKIYADFEYPEDMASCSIYHQDGIGPLVAMSRLIETLKQRLSVKN
jgi:hypothetical protein